MSLPPTPWTMHSDTYTGEVVLRDATGKPFLTIPAQAEMVDAPHAVGLVKRRWRMEQAESLARLLCAAPAMLECLTDIRDAAEDYDIETAAKDPEWMLDDIHKMAEDVLDPLDQE